MPFDNNSIDNPFSVMSEEINLGLVLPDGIDLQPFFPEDRLLRLHPNWFISNFVQDKENFTADIKDYAKENKSCLSGRIEFNLKNLDLLTITLKGTDDIIIRFFNRHNLLFVQTCSAGQINAEDPVLLWIKAIREYIRLYLTTTPITWFFRIIMNKMVLQMNPSQRKICLMLAKITFVEIMVIIFIVIGYAIFVLK